MLFPFFQWMENLAVYGASPYIGPIVNLVHLLSMVTFVGGLLVVDLRLLGVGLKHQPLSVVARDAWPWIIGGFIGILITGMPQLAERATDQYANSIFWMKMWVLGFGLVFWATIWRKTAKADEPRGVMPKVLALVSIGIWVFVATSARMIMLLPADFFFDVGLFK